MPPRPPILIAGGGVAGLAVALGLAQNDIECHILERRRAFSEAGAGIQLGPNGVRALAAIGALDALVPLAGRPDAIHVRDGRSGTLLAALPLGDWIEQRHGAPYLVVHRRDLQAALLAAVAEQPAITVHTGFAVERIEPDRGAVRVLADDGREQSGAALIGADGLFSTVRRHLHPKWQPQFSGRTAARAVVPADAMPTPLDGNATGVWLAPNAHVVHYPVRGAREVAVVVIRAEGWHQEGWSGPVEAADLSRALEAFAPALRQALSQPTDWRRWALFEATPLPSWSDATGRIVLIGDAAHPVLPFLAQGGSLALEDAIVLARLLAANAADIRSAVTTFEALRKARTTAVAAAARSNGRIYHLGGIAAAARNSALRLAPPGRLMARYDWIYRWRPADR